MLRETIFLVISERLFLFLLKPFVAPGGRKCVEYFALGLTLKAFHSKNIRYVYNFYGTDLYVNVCRGIFRTQSNIYGGASLQKSQETFIVDVRLGSKYASGIGFTVENVYRMSIFVDMVKADFKNLPLPSCFSNQ